MAHSNLPIFRRRLFNCLTMLSLLLCLATVALWVQSYWRFQKLYRSGEGWWIDALAISSVRGELSFYRSEVSGTRSPWKYYCGPSNEESAFDNMNPRAATFIGFGYASGSFVPVRDASDASRSFQTIYFPDWFLALLFAVLPALRLRTILRTRRLNRVGLCTHCGYDLRASPDRCPECGTAQTLTAEH